MPLSPSPTFAADLARAHAGDIEARNKIVVENMGLVYATAKRINHCHLSQEDKVSLGCEALMHAVRCFNPDRGIQFSTYASCVIARHIVRAAITDGVVRHPTQGPKRFATVTGLDAVKVGLSTPPDSAMEDYEQELRASAAFLMLSEREQTIVRLRCIEEETLQTVAQVVGVSRERVRQVEAEALRKLRRELEAAW